MKLLDLVLFIIFKYDHRIIKFRIIKTLSGAFPQTDSVISGFGTHDLHLPFIFSFGYGFKSFPLLTFHQPGFPPFWGKFQNRHTASEGCNRSSPPVMAVRAAVSAHLPSKTPSVILPMSTSVQTALCEPWKGSRVDCYSSGPLSLVLNPAIFSPASSSYFSFLVLNGHKSSLSL